MLRKTGLLVAAVAVLLNVGVPVAASATAEDCAVTWGSTMKTDAPVTGAELVGLRAGRHDCYDRLVFDARGPVNGYWVSYVDEMTEDATGDVIALRGGAKLAVTIYSPAYDNSGAPTYSYANRAELVDATGFRTFRQVAWAGSWEGTTSVGIGVRARLPFRVFTLPGRVVIDVAHSW